MSLFDPFRDDFGNDFSKRINEYMSWFLNTGGIVDYNNIGIGSGKVDTIEIDISVGKKRVNES